MKVDAVRRSSCRSLRLAQRGEALGDALERLAGLEGEPHLPGGEAEVGAGVQLQRLGLGVAEALGDVFDGEARVLKQPVGVEDARRGEEVARRRQAEAREPALEGAAVHAGARGYLLDGLQVGGGAPPLPYQPTQTAPQPRQER